MLTDEQFEGAAAAIHERMVRALIAEGRAVGAAENYAPWAQLSARARVEMRAHAHLVVAALADVGLTIVTTADAARRAPPT